MKTQKSPSREKKESVEDRLLATAGRCFTEDGFGFGIDDILKQSGVAKMSLYAKFGSKYGLIECLLDETARKWETEMNGVAVEATSSPFANIIQLIRSLCAGSRDLQRRTGLISQALVEFPLTKKEDETHRKKDLVHKKARDLQLGLLNSLENVCGEAGIEEAQLVGRQILLLISGYLLMEPLLGKTQALELTIRTAQELLETSEDSVKPVARNGTLQRTPHPSLLAEDAPVGSVEADPDTVERIKRKTFPKPEIEIDLAERERLRKLEVRRRKVE